MTPDPTSAPAPAPMTPGEDPVIDVREGSGAALDPAVRAAYDVLGALDAETDALDHLLLRCRATMLLASAAELHHLTRAGDDLDAASTALDHASNRRRDVVETALGTWGGAASSARELVAAAPEEFRDAIASRLEVQRSLLSEATEAVDVARTLGERSLEVLAARRNELGTRGRPALTYGARPDTPPAVVQRLV